VAGSNVAHGHRRFIHRLGRIDQRRYPCPMPVPSTPPRVVLLGKNALAVGCLEVLREGGAEIVLVVADPGDDGSDGWQPSLAGAAERAGIPIERPSRINDPLVVEAVTKLRPEILLSCQYAQILGAGIRAAASVGTLNLHFGLLPRYRGVAPIYWAIHNGETEAGVTLHHVDAGIDSGDLIAAARVSIRPDDTARDLYERSTAAGIELLRETWPAIRAGDIPRRPQDRTESLYYNRYSVDYERRRLEWNADCETIANRARALIFPPFQYPEVCLSGEILEVGRVDRDRGDHQGRPGQILAVDDAGLLVAAPGGRLRLGDLRLGGRPLDGAALARLEAAPGVMLE
jgi:methionyl-tRNA formyltransferase